MRLAQIDAQTSNSRSLADGIACVAARVKPNPIFEFGPIATCKLQACLDNLDSTLLFSLLHCRQQVRGACQVVVDMQHCEVEYTFSDTVAHSIHRSS